jgi:hypothetical protein
LPAFSSQILQASSFGFSWMAVAARRRRWRAGWGTKARLAGVIFPSWCFDAAP